MLLKIIYLSSGYRYCRSCATTYDRGDGGVAATIGAMVALLRRYDRAMLRRYDNLGSCTVFCYATPVWKTAPFCEAAGRFGSVRFGSVRC